jgi:hypothetical protein
MTGSAAYTYYAFLEWSLVFWDVLFDHAALAELGHPRVCRHILPGYECLTVTAVHH